MSINQHKLWRIYLVAVDLISMTLSFIIAASFVVSEVDGVPFIEFFSIRISILNFIIFMVFTLIWYIVLDLSGAYYIRRLTTKKKAIIKIIKRITCVGFRLNLLSYSSLNRINPPKPAGMFMLLFCAMNL